MRALFLRVVADSNDNGSVVLFLSALGEEIKWVKKKMSGEGYVQNRVEGAYPKGLTDDIKEVWHRRIMLKEKDYGDTTLYTIMVGEREPKVITARYKLLNGSIKTLVKRVGDGAIIARFEKTPLPEKTCDVICPHFLEFKWANGCPYRCAWCYLQGTYRFHPMKNKPREKARKIIRAHLDAFFDFNGPPELLNSGELSDSLMTEYKKEPFSCFILPFFENQDKHKILFLSKSNNVRNILKWKENGQAIMSFSVNADEIAKRWECAPDVDCRIEAAKQVSKIGYETRLRIDPMVPYGNWEDSYKKLIDKIFNKFEPDRITIGSLRGLQSTINEASDKSWTQYLSEWSNWGRKIAFDLRYNMYSTVLNYLKEEYDYTKVALCKETVEMWKSLDLDFKKIKCNCTF